jgi:hypothetical protein
MGQGTSKYRKIKKREISSCCLKNIEIHPKLLLNKHLTHYKASVHSSSKWYSITQLLNYSVLFCPYVSSCIDSILYIYIYI